MSMLDVKKNYIITEAADQFSKRPIKDVTIKDIAVAAGVGEATVYRYFGTKGDLIVACVEKLEKEVSGIFIDKKTPFSPLSAIERFYNAYLVIFNEKPQLYRFLNEFDAYVINEGIGGLDSYADAIDAYKDLFIQAYELGVAEGTINKVSNIDLFYYSTTHAIIALCKKLSYEKPVIRQDLKAEEEKENEISTLIGIILDTLRK